MMKKGVVRWRGATVEGMNIGALLLGSLAFFIVGIAILVALGLVIAGRTRAAPMTFSGGFLAMAVLGALAALSYLQRGMGFHQEGSDPTLILIALSLVLAGSGQFVASFRSPRIFAAALACAIGALAILWTPLLGGDLLHSPNISRIFAAHSLSLPWINLGLALSLLLAALSMIIALASAERRNCVLLMT